ncbi:MAG TPA: hypothetical protein VFP60_05015 [Pseudolabrys sp.]|nr:hypothetical protein [Pseudolabrys sp.]
MATYAPSNFRAGFAQRGKTKTAASAAFLGGKTNFQQKETARCAENHKRNAS